MVAEMPVPIDNIFVLARRQHGILSPMTPTAFKPYAVPYMSWLPSLPSKALEILHHRPIVPCTLLMVAADELP